jgi:hypothetical protein
MPRDREGAQVNYLYNAGQSLELTIGQRPGRFPNARVPSVREEQPQVLSHTRKGDSVGVL